MTWITIDTAPKTRTQCERIKAYLLNGGEVTQLQAYDLFGCTRLASRIHDLKKEGMDIVDRWVKPPGGAVIKAYRLATHQYELTV